MSAGEEVATQIEVAAVSTGQMSRKSKTEYMKIKQKYNKFRAIYDNRQLFEGV